MEKGSCVEASKVDKELIDADEVSLMELWAVLLRRWKTVATLSALCLLIGIAAVLSTSTKFLFSTTIDLARTSSTLIKPVAAIQAELKESYIPRMIAAENRAEVLETDVKNPRGSQVLVLTSLGRSADEEAIRTLHQSILDLLIKEQEALIEAVKDPLRKEHSLLEARVKIDTQRINKLRQSETRLEKALTEIESSPASSSKEVAVASVLQAASLNLRALMDAEHAITDYQLELNGLKLNMDMIQPATADQVAVRSQKPVGIGKAAMVLLSVVIGLFLGVLAAFFQEFIAKVCRSRGVVE
ncbi:MAG TPA: hypothetical protein ENJ13_02640 [Chromatiales bacterium]|nr:hypothetical protein [Chromatiales bacterium]